MMADFLQPHAVGHSPALGEKVRAGDGVTSIECSARSVSLYSEPLPRSRQTQAATPIGGVQPSCQQAGGPALHSAAAAGDLPAVLRLLACGANPNERSCVHASPDSASDTSSASSSVSRRGGCGTTALCLAIQAGHAPVVRALLGAGACASVGDCALARQSGNRAVMDAVAAWNSSGQGSSSGAVCPAAHAASATLFAAVENNDLDMLFDLLAAGADPNQPESRSSLGITPLHVAAQLGHGLIVQALIAAGAKVNARLKNHFTPLHEAASRGHAEAIAALAEAGAALNSRSSFGTSALHEAAFSGHASAISVLVAAGADMEARDDRGWSPLHTAAGSSEEGVRALLAAGACPAARDQDGRTPLELAQEAQLQSAVQMLQSVAGCAVPSLAVEGGRQSTPAQPGTPQVQPPAPAANLTSPATASGLGAQLGSTTSMPAGAAAGADELASAGQPSMLLEAAAAGDLPAISRLLAGGANPCAADEYGETPIHAAARLGHAAAVQALVVAGGKVNAELSNGFTPLHEAASAGQVPAIRTLAAAGAALNAKSCFGTTALHEAAFSGQAAAVQALLAEGAEVDARDQQGRTPLHLAAQRSVASVRALLAGGAAIAPRDKAGATPLDLSLDADLPEITSLLLDATGWEAGGPGTGRMSRLAQAAATPAKEAGAPGPWPNFLRRMAKKLGRSALKGKGLAGGAVKVK